MEMGVYHLKNSDRGAWGNGFTIKSEMNPLAREGTDFKVFDDIVLVLNRNAIRIIPESLDVSRLSDYLKLVEHSNGRQTALLVRLGMRLDRRLYINRNQPEIKKEIQEAFNLVGNSNNTLLWEHFFKLKISHLDDQMIENLIHNTSSSNLHYVTRFVFSQKHWKDHSKLKYFIEKIIDLSVKFIKTLKVFILLSSISSLSLTLKCMGDSIAKLIDAAVKMGDYQSLENLARTVFHKSHIKDRENLIKKLIDAAITLREDGILRDLAFHTFDKAHTKDMGYLIEELIDAAIELKISQPLEYLASTTFSQPHTKHMTHIIEKLIDAAFQIKGSYILHNLAVAVFSKPHTKDMGYLIEKLMDAAVQLRDKETLHQLIKSTFSQSHTDT